MPPRDDLLCWIDLEMTGLDPEQNTIVEMATILTDNALEVVAVGPEIVIHSGEDHLQRMIPIVREMHTKSGLVDRVRQSTVNVRDAELETLVFLKEHVKERSAPLCGNSIWCDRMFLKLQMPRLDAWLHYRTVDVSSFKECATRWNVGAIGGAPRKGDKHRALDDIRESIAELKHYKDRWLAPHRAPAAKASDGGAQAAAPPGSTGAAGSKDQGRTGDAPRRSGRP